MSKIAQDTDPYENLKTNFVTAVYEAQLLIDYVAKQGLTVEKTHIKHIVDFKQLLQQGQWTPDDEVNFWVAFSAIAEIVKPVTIASLKASSDRYSTTQGTLLSRKRRNKSPARKAVNLYRNWTLYTLVLLLIIQIYWLIGTKVLNDLKELPQKISVIQLEIGKLQTAMRAESPGNAPLDNGLKLMQLKLDIKNYTNQTATSDKILTKWNKVWLTLINPMRIFMPAQIGAEDSSLASKMENQTSATFVIEILQFYVLPLLYGLLGACTYVLRVLSIEINRLIYSTDSDIRYHLRLYLGILSGLVVAWFFSGERTPSVLKSLPPMALAFFAGYSVEVIFAIMDKFISNFSDDIPQKQGAKSE